MGYRPYFRILIYRLRHFNINHHPLYSAWVVFIVPGIIFLENSWIGMTTPVFMYLLLYRLVIKEENYLEQIFGSEYLAYKKKTPCILPLGCF